MKRKISLLLLISILAGLTACGGNETPTETTVPSDTSNQSDSAETTLVGRLADANYNGYEFNIFGENQSFSGDYFDVETETGDIIGDSVYRRNRTVEEKYNIELNFHTVDWQKGPETIRSLILAGDNEYDLYTCTHLSLGSLMLENYFVDWKSVPGIDLSLPCYVKDANTTYSIGGVMPLLFGDFMETNSMRCWSFLFNKRLVEEYQLENPYTVVDEGRWTIDYLIKTARDIYSDLDGNSTMDQNDMYAFVTDTLATLDGFTRGLGLSAISKDKDNLPMLDFYKESTVTAYEKLYTLYYECAGTYPSTENMTHVENIFAEGRAVFASTRLDFVMKEAVRNMKDDYGVIPYPKLDESGEYATYLSGTFSAQMIGVTQPEANRERTEVITQALNAYSHEYVIPSICEITLKTKTTRDDDSVRMMNLIFDSRQYSFDSIDENGFPFSPLRSVRSLLSSKSKDIASYYAKNQNAAEEWVENIIETFTSASE